MALNKLNVTSKTLNMNVWLFEMLHVALMPQRNSVQHYMKAQNTLIVAKYGFDIAIHEATILN